MKNLKIAAAATAILAATAVGAAAQAPVATAADPAMAAATTEGAGTFLGYDAADHTLASDWIGTDVRGAGGDAIGKVKDVVVGPDGRVVAAVLAVGGFLGVGEKDVVVDLASLTDAPSDGGDPELMVNATKETLEAAPAFVAPEGRTALVNAGGAVMPDGGMVTEPTGAMAPATDGASVTQ